MNGGTTFHFVTDGIESAYAQAEAAAGGKDISIAGGASCARQAINAGLVDEDRPASGVGDPRRG
jgi:dihydrofolate reductase